MEPTRPCSAMACCPSVGAGGNPSMWTTALAFLILFMGFITFAGGALGVLFLMFEDLVQTGRVPLRYYAMMLALISGGLSMMGMAQGLRLLLLLVVRG